jgi:hypothetical protein
VDQVEYEDLKVLVVLVESVGQVELQDLKVQVGQVDLVVQQVVKVLVDLVE